MSDYGPPPGYGQQQPPQYGAPGYGAPQQPGYGAPGYGPPGPGYGAPPPYGVPERLVRRPSIPGVLITVIGIAALVVAFFFLDWFHPKNSGAISTNGKATFGKVHDAIDRVQRSLVTDHLTRYVSYGVAHLYFSWLGWVLAAATVVFALLAVVPSAVSAFFRVLAPLVALGSAGITVWALNLISVSGAFARAIEAQYNTTIDFGYWLKQTSIGTWLALAGFVVVAIGSAFGSRRTVRPPS